MAIPDKLRDFVNEQRQPLPPVTDVDEPLSLESVQMMRLVGFSESELAFRVNVFQLVPQNFESRRALERLREGKGVKDLGRAVISALEERRRAERRRQIFL